MRKGIWQLGAVALIFCMAASNGLAQNVVGPNGQVQTIFSFKDDIGLTDQQELNLKALLYDEQAVINADNLKLKDLGAQLAKMIDEKADMPLIKSKLEEVSKIQVDVSCLNIEDARKVEAILSPEQLEKWRAIQKKFNAPASK